MGSIPSYIPHPKKNLQKSPKINSEAFRGILQNKFHPIRDNAAVPYFDNSVAIPDMTSIAMVYLSWVHTMRSTYSWCVMCECVQKIRRI